MWPFTIALEPGQATGNLPGPYDFRGYRCKTHCVATNKPRLHAVSRRRANRRVLRHGTDDRRHRARGRPRALGSAPREPRAGLRDAVRQRSQQALRQRRLSEGAARRARDEIGFAKWRERQKRGEPDGRLHRHRLCHLLRAERARHQRVRRLGPADRAGLRPGNGAGDAGRRPRGARRRAFARPGHGDDARAGRQRNAGHRHRAISAWCSATPEPRPTPPAPMHRAASSWRAAPSPMPARRCCRARAHRGAPACRPPSIRSATRTA